MTLPFAMERTCLVVGMGRSGTTWVGKMLDAHPGVYGKHEPDNRGELPFFRDLPSRLDPAGDERYVDLFRDGLAGAFWHHSIKLDPPPRFPKDFVRPRLWGALDGWSRLRHRVNRHAHVVRIPRGVFRRDPMSLPFVVKSVISTLRLAWIARHFPQVKIAMILRHPGGYLNSWLSGEWAQRIGTRERLDATVLPMIRPEHERYLPAYESCGGVERELIFWIVGNETPLMQLSGHPNFKVLVYEDLCVDPMGGMRDLCAFFGIDMHDKMQRFIAESTTSESSGYHDVHKDPLRVAYKWRGKLEPGCVEMVERYLEGSTLARYWAGHRQRIAQGAGA